MVGRGRHRPALRNEKALLGRKTVSLYDFGRVAYVACSYAAV